MRGLLACLVLTSAQDEMFSPGSGHMTCKCATAFPARVNISGPWVPDTYGRGCLQHDQNLSVECIGGSSGVEPWCASFWCYVDPFACELPSQISERYPGLSFSYETCGSVNKYHTSLLRKLWANNSLKIAHMTNSGGWKGSFCSDSSDETSCSGPTSKFLMDVVKTAGGYYVDHIYTNVRIPDLDKALDPAVVHAIRRDDPGLNNAFNACAYATGMGFLDMCLGAFTMTQSRLTSSSFLALYQEPVYLFAKVQKEESASFGDLLAKTLDPLTPGAWAAISAVFVAVSLCFVHTEWRIGGSLEDVPNLWMALVEATSNTFGAFLGVGGHDLTCKRSKMLNIALGVTVLFAVTLYTANLASILVVQKEKVSGIADFAEVVSRRLSICCQDILSEQLLNMGVAESELRLVQSRSQLLPRLAVDEWCDVALMRLEDFEVARGQADAGSCEVVRVGLDPLLQVNMGLPVSDRVKKQAQLALQRLSNEGVFASHLSQRKPDDACPAEEPESEAIGIDSFTLPLLISGILILLAAALSSFKEFRQFLTRPSKLGSAVAESSEAMPRDEDMQSLGHLLKQSDADQQAKLERIGTQLVEVQALLRTMTDTYCL